jgi:hypothetical protein
MRKTKFIWVSQAHWSKRDNPPAKGTSEMKCSSQLSFIWFSISNAAIRTSEMALHRWTTVTPSRNLLKIYENWWTVSSYDLKISFSIPGSISGGHRLLSLTEDFSWHSIWHRYSDRLYFRGDKIALRSVPSPELHLSVMTRNFLRFHESDNESPDHPSKQKTPWWSFKWTKK